MKTLLFLPLLALALASCSNVDLIVDTREAVPVGPDMIKVPSSAVTPVISQDAINDLVEAGNNKLAEIITGTK